MIFYYNAYKFLVPKKGGGGDESCTASAKMETNTTAEGFFYTNTCSAILSCCNTGAVLEVYH